MQIRFLTADDADEWSRLRVQSLKGDPEAFGSFVEEHQTLTVSDIRKRIGSSAEDSFVVGAFEDKILVGMAGFFREKGPKRQHKGFIWGVYVSPEQRRRGLARQLFTKIFERVRQIHGVEQVLISVASTQSAAANLYHSLGFETFGIEPRALKVEGRYIDEHCMQLRVR
jgi:ribosomal protein S18 acetylase RimI-like enzyme